MSGGIFSALSQLFDPFDRDDRPGLVVGIQHQGRTLFQRACGLASVQHGVANSLATRMEIGSVTKAFTAMLALRLAERSLLQLEDELARWLPELPRLAGSPTLRQLLEHRAGYRDYLDCTFAEGFVVRPGDAVLEFHRRTRTVNFPPGSAQLYSNSGYALLSLALERAADQSFSQLLQTEVLDPLQLRVTKPLRADWPIEPDMASCHVPLPDGKGYRAGFSIVKDRLGDGCLIGDVSDLLTWLEAVRLRASVLSPRSWEVLTCVQAPSRGGEYALGLRVRSHRGALTWSHGGGVMGGSAYVLTVPEHALDIAMLANTPLPLERLTHEAVDLILSDVLQPTPGRVDVSDGWQQHLGTYQDVRQGSLLQLGEQAGQLTISEFSGPAVYASSAEHGAVTLASPVGVTRIDRPSPQGGLSAIRAGQSIGYDALCDSTAEGICELADVTGTYHCAELQACLHVSVDQERLSVRCRGAHGWNRLILEPLAPAMFAVRHELMPQAAVFRFHRAPGSGATLEYSSQRTWRLRFERESRS